jgi:galactokinase
MSSSAAYEDMIGNILNHLYNDGSVDNVEIAQLAQFAENEFFGKPCGLMDQVACAAGGIVSIDFADPASPVIEKMARASKVEFVSEKPAKEDEFATVVTSCAQCYIPMGELVDKDKEIERLEKELATVNSEFKRAEGKLNNESFVSKAPAKLVDAEREKVNTVQTATNAERIHPSTRIFG